MKKYKLTKIHSIQKGGFNDKCKNYPELPTIVDIDKNKINRIIAIGDIHGDLDLALNLLLMSKVIEEIFQKEKNCVKLKYKNNENKYYKWIGKKTIVVQVGDQIDRCRPYKNGCDNINETYLDEASDIKILIFYHQLHKLALKKGCAVYSLLGNHEILNVIGNLNYVSYLGLTQFNNIDKENKDISKNRKKVFNINSKKIFYNDTNLATFLGCTRQSSIIVGDYLFVHAGIINKLINNLDTSNDNRLNLDIINKIIKKWLLNDISNENDIKIINKLLIDKDLSPFWPRFFGTLAPNLPADHKLCIDNINPILKYFVIKGIVVGHTPQLELNINSTCNNTVWRVDIAGSHAFDNIIESNPLIDSSRHPQILEIILSIDKPDIYNIYKLLPNGEIIKL